MSADRVVHGDQSQVRWNGFVLATKGGSVRETADDHDVSDTESGQAKKTKGGMTVLQVQIDCELATDVFPSAASLNIFGSSQNSVLIYPYGLSNQPITIPKFVTLEYTPGEWRVGETVKFSVAGKSNGSYTFPTA
jgi:hypothetical protein